MKKITVFGWGVRLFVLLILFYVFYLGGAQTISGKLPDIKPEPGLVSVGIGLLLVGIANTILVAALVLSSKWGWFTRFAIIITGLLRGSDFCDADRNLVFFIRHHS
jgi:hypothetical protein